MPTTKLLDRVRAQLETMDAAAGFTEKQIVGGTGFLIRGNLVCGEVGGALLVRLGKEGGAFVRFAKAEAGQARTGEAPSVRRMMMGGRESKNWFLVDADLVRTKKPLREWLDRAMEHTATLPDA
ncbi:TfoX/Sxy family protein [Lysinimonas soli]|uniref:TfoX/Sxy family protein n=1 Tax=Lysinimonas soli TaxID=1074233 RepID=A0ABW0NQP9_9MICO